LTEIENLKVELRKVKKELKSVEDKMFALNEDKFEVLKKLHGIELLIKNINQKKLF